MSIYLDNAATTPLDPAVLTAMTPYLLANFGNPSSQHQFGREAKAALERSRKIIANLIGADADEIIFTSGGTEADNLAIVSAITCGKIDHVITTPFEHPAVLQTLKSLSKQYHTRISHVKHNAAGDLDLDHLEYLLRTNTRNLVTIMHANNEIGNLNDIAAIGKLCEKYKAVFHTDAVQTMGHLAFDLSKLNIDYLAASAHKFHGPKGVGFLYCRKGSKLTRLIHGGGQEKQVRAGTENLPGIIGMTKALQLAYADREAHQTHIEELKAKLIAGIIDLIPDVQFNGRSAKANDSIYTVLSASFPAIGVDLLSYLDVAGVAVSGGSACCTGSTSAVLQALGADPDRPTIRFSFSRFNTVKEIDQVIEKLAVVFQVIAA
jgi:cysteine desulfurase